MHPPSGIVAVSSFSFLSALPPCRVYFSWRGLRLPGHLCFPLLAFQTSRLSSDIRWSLSFFFFLDVRAVIFRLPTKAEATNLDFSLLFFLLPPATNRAPDAFVSFYFPFFRAFYRPRPTSFFSCLGAPPFAVDPASPSVPLNSDQLSVAPYRLLSGKDCQCGNHESA